MADGTGWGRDPDSLTDALVLDPPGLILPSAIPDAPDCSGLLETPREPCLFSQRIPSSEGQVMKLPPFCKSVVALPFILHLTKI